jgi:hypothetical protein
MEYASIQLSDQYRGACGSIVTISEKARRHLEGHLNVIQLLPEAIQKTWVSSSPIPEIEVDMGRIIGRTNLVDTLAADPSTPMQFALRKGRILPSRVTSEVAAGQETDKLVLVARKQHPRTYQLVTSWIGSLARKEPWDYSIRSAHEFEECLRFWCSNALLHDSETMGPMFESSWTEVLRNCR